MRLLNTLLLTILSCGCTTVRPLSYMDFLRQMDDKFYESYVNGNSVDEAERALHVYLVRLNELQRHPDCPKDFEVDFSRSRGITEARLATLHKFLGNQEKADAFATEALTHLPDAQARTKQDVYEFAGRMDTLHKLKWKKEDTQQSAGEERR